MKNILFFCITALALLAIVSCKTNENNYRAAYEAAVAQRQESSGIDSTIYSRIRNSARQSSLTVGTDSLPLRTEYIGYPKDGGSSRENVGRYCVVVGQFKQIFNAKAMRDRLITDGYHAMIVNTREPLYYVVAASCTTAAEAAREYSRVSHDSKLVLRSPLPFILQPAHLAR